MKLHSFISCILKKHKEDLADADCPPKKVAPSTEQAAFLPSFIEYTTIVFSLPAYRKYNLRPTLTSSMRNPLVMDDN